MAKKLHEGAPPFPRGDMGFKDFAGSEPGQHKGKHRRAHPESRKKDRKKAHAG